MAARIRRGCAHARPDTAGQSTVEFALVLPLFFGLLVLLFQVALVGRDEILVVHAARAAAREASVTTDLARINAATAARCPVRSCRSHAGAGSASLSRSTSRTRSSRACPSWVRCCPTSRCMPRGDARRAVTSSARSRAGERGSVVVLMVAAVVIAALCCVAAARLGGAATQRARADTAADAAALAAADALALGRPAAAAASAARQVADDNGAGSRHVCVRGRGRRGHRVTGPGAGSGTSRGRPLARSHQAQQGDRAALVEVLVPVAALRRLHARRAAVVARAPGDELERRVAWRSAASNASSAMPAPPG